MAYDGTLMLGFLKETHETKQLTEREKQLVGLAVTLTRGCQVCTRGRIEKARELGISEAALNALFGIVAAVNAGVAAATAREAFRGLPDTAASEPCGDLCAVPEPAAAGR
jgi:AhpD family alkylhydroperoxidase